MIRAIWWNTMRKRLQVQANRRRATCRWSRASLIAAESVQLLVCTAMQRLRPLPALVVTLAALGGCAGSGTAHPGRPGSADAAIALAGAGQVGVTTIHPAGAKAQYAAFAHAVNLRSGDLPGFASHPHPREQGVSEGTIARACHLGGLDSRHLAKFSSSAFEAGPARYREHASSEVEIARSPGAARTGVTAVQRLVSNIRTRECLAVQYRREFTRSAGSTRTRRGLRMRLMSTEVQIKPLSVERPAGAEVSGAFAVGVTAVLQVAAHGRKAEIPVSVVSAVRYFAVGRAIVRFSTWATDTQFPPELEKQVISLLASRASGAAREFPALGS